MFVSFAQTDPLDPADDYLTRVINTYDLVPHTMFQQKLSLVIVKDVEFEVDSGDHNHQIYDLELSSDGMKIFYY